MRRVLYTYDMEPITVVELGDWAEDYLKQIGRVSLCVWPPMNAFALSEAANAIKFKAYQVNIVAERLICRGQEHLLLFTADEESALLLRAAFLPGQQAALQERERAAFANGFLEALYRVGR
jgi:hypothetical protein